MKIKPLSELEQSVMEIVWSLGTCTVRDVVDKLPDSKPLAYTTIATIMNRLVEKGTLLKSSGSISAYTPCMSKEMTGRTVAQSFLKNFFRSYGDSAVVSFAESIDQLPAEKKQHLLNILKAHEK